MRELEGKCRAQSEQFSQLSRHLEQLRQHTGAINLLGGSSVALPDAPTFPSKPFPQFMNGLAPSIGKSKHLATWAAVQRAGWVMGWAQGSVDGPLLQHPGRGLGCWEVGQQRASQH